MLLILDVDGVMTDGTKTYNHDHYVLSKKYCDQDFSAIKLFKDRGWSVCLLTSDIFNKGMADKRNIDFYNSRNADGTIDKVGWLRHFCEIYDVDMSDMVYIGDDIMDADVMKTIATGGGQIFCPKGSCPYISRLCGKKHSLKRRGGEGVVMELYDKFHKTNYSLRKLF